MILKSGMKVQVKSLKWYDENKDKNGWIETGTRFGLFMKQYCGTILTLTRQSKINNVQGFNAQETEQIVWHESFLLPVSNIFEEEEDE